ncbi:DMT family transporter [Metabacillus sp. RGM 3146]|uniref:DMT family transporter n=1 Tax=Metabacillus sp. RGM 3146 TaxID=3401092 RepID=UPI003B991F76
MKKRALMADAGLLLVAFIWGTTFVIVQKAIDFVPPNFFNGCRFLLASLILLIWWYAQISKKSGIISLKIIGAGALLGLFLFLGYSLQTVGLLYTTTSKAGFITGLSVMIVPLFSVMLLKIKLKWKAAAGAIMGTIGLYLLTNGGVGSFNHGDLLILFCAIAFALHIIITGMFTEKFDALSLTIVQLLTVSFLSFTASLFFEKSPVIKQPIFAFFSFEVISALIITSLFATAFAFWAQTAFQKYTSAARVALIFAMEPVFAALAAIILIGERLTSEGLIGCLLIFLAMIIAELPDKAFHLLQKKESTKMADK